MPREASLAVELCLGAAAAAAFAAMLIRDPRAGSIAWGAMMLGGIAAVIAAVLTFRIDAVWFFEALRVDTVTQALKGLIAVGVVVTAARRPSADPRAVVPFFALVAALGLSLAAGAGDLVVLWIALDIASAALVLAVATGGSAHDRAGKVRRLLGAWLPMSLVMLLGIIMTSAIAGSTHLTDLETILPSMRAVPVALAGVSLIALSIVIRGARYVAVLLRG